MIEGRINEEMRGMLNITKKRVKEEDERYETNKILGIDEEDESIEEKDQKNIEKEYNNKKYPNLKLTAEYLNRKFLDGEYKLDKKEIIKDLKINMGLLNSYLCKLNRYRNFQPVRWISILGKKDWIEMAGADFRNSNKWIKKNLKGNISRKTRIIQTTEKVKYAEETKALEQQKKKISNEIKLTKKRR